MKGHTREGDAIAAARRRLPMVEVGANPDSEGIVMRNPFDTRPLICARGSGLAGFSRLLTRRAWALVLASTASFVVTLDLLIVTTALDTIRRDFDASISTLQWVLTAYSVTFACLLLTGAALGDRFGRRRVFAIGNGVFLAGSILAAMSGSIGMLVAARIVQGAGVQSFCRSD